MHLKKIYFTITLIIDNYTEFYSKILLRYHIIYLINKKKKKFNFLTSYIINKIFFNLYNYIINIFIINTDIK